VYTKAVAVKTLVVEFIYPVISSGGGEGVQGLRLGEGEERFSLFSPPLFSFLFTLSPFQFKRSWSKEK
jgi:hypothetical protein